MSTSLSPLPNAEQIGAVCATLSFVRVQVTGEVLTSFAPTTVKWTVTVLNGLVPGALLMDTVGPMSSISQPTVAAGPTLPAVSVGVTVSVWMPLLVMECVVVEPPAVHGKVAPPSIWQAKVSFASPAVKVIVGLSATATGPGGRPLNVTGGGGVRSTVHANVAAGLLRRPVAVPTTEKLCAPSTSPA